MRTKYPQVLLLYVVKFFACFFIGHSERSEESYVLLERDSLDQSPQNDDYLSFLNFYHHKKSKSEEALASFNKLKLRRFMRLP